LEVAFWNPFGEMGEPTGDGEFDVEMELRGIDGTATGIFDGEGVTFGVVVAVVVGIVAGIVEEDDDGEEEGGDDDSDNDDDEVLLVVVGDCFDTTLFAAANDPLRGGFAGACR